MREERELRRAVFDEKLVTYWMIGSLILLAVTFVGIPLIPVWLFVGQGFHRRQWERMECVLTEKTLNVRRGVFFRVEKNIPLDKIQDMAMKEGPILRRLGLSSLTVETAGQSQPQGGDASLTGIVDAPAFRDAVLNQRDLVVGGLQPSASREDEDALLLQIRDSLQRIEGLLAQRSS